MNSAAEEKKTQEEGQNTTEQNSSKKLTEEIEKLNTEIAQLTAKNNEFLVNYKFSSFAHDINVFVSGQVQKSIS